MRSRFASAMLYTMALMALACGSTPCSSRTVVQHESPNLTGFTPVTGRRRLSKKKRKQSH